MLKPHEVEGYFRFQKKLWGKERGSTKQKLVVSILFFNFVWRYPSDHIAVSGNLEFSHGPNLTKEKESIKEKNKNPFQQQKQEKQQKNNKFIKEPKRDARTRRDEKEMM